MIKNPSIDELLVGNILIGSRFLNMAKPNSDWDIVCTQETLDYIFYNFDIRSNVSYPNGYDACRRIMSEQIFDSCDEDYSDTDQGGFGSDLISIEEIIFQNGLKINLFIYPNKRKWKRYKKLKKEMLKLKYEDPYLLYDKDLWVSDFIDCQYMFGINEDLS